ncbi:MAG: MjaI family restriction endonuclease [Desulfococcus multivorans]|jgi:hypothetical protein|nr:MjaI family restriction endonuclease [Desulfococcus multivorans]
MNPKSLKWFFCIFVFGAIGASTAMSQEKTEAAGTSFVLPMAQIMADVAEKPADFPKYTTQLINLANQNSQATRPCYVGQMSDLIQEFPGDTYDAWVHWYLAKYPNAIDEAADKTHAMIENMREAMAKIDRDMVREWIRELILVKTYAGLRFQESILKAMAEKQSTTYRLARPEEEAKGIDGFIGGRAVSIKPETYGSKPFLPETIDADIIFYEKIRGGIRVWQK